MTGYNLGDEGSMDAENRFPHVLGWGDAWFFESPLPAGNPSNRIDNKFLTGKPFLILKNAATAQLISCEVDAVSASSILCAATPGSTLFYFPAATRRRLIPVFVGAKPRPSLPT